MSRISSADRARRLLAVLHFFEPDAEIPLETIADSVGASVDEISADLELLACCGVAPYTPEALLPIYIEDGKVVVWGPLPALDRAVRLSRREAHALATALAAAAVEPGDPLARKLLEAASSEGDAERTAGLLRAGTSIDAVVLQQLTLALEQRLLVCVAYQSTGSEQATERIVEPMGLVNERGFWYLEAFCRNAGALRTFRIDRMRSVAAMREHFEPRQLTPSGTAFVSEGLPHALVRFQPGEEFSLRDWPGARVIDTEGDGGLLVSVPYAGTAWLARRVVARLGGVRVLEPAEVRIAVAELAAASRAASG